MIKREYNKWSAAEIEAVKLLYPSTIKKMADKLGVKRQSRHMDQILGKAQNLLAETTEAYYWIGFLLSDGHLSKLHRLKFTLNAKDLKSVQHLSSFLEMPPESVKIEKNTNCTITLMDTFNIKKVKEKFDIQSRKTYKPPQLDIYSNMSDDLFLSLLAGFIDGDGSIQYQYKRSDCRLSIKLHNSWKPFLELIRDKIIQLFKIIFPEPKQNKDGYALLSISNNEILRNLKLKILSLNLPIMNRKWDRVHLMGRV